MPSADENWPAVSGIAFGGDYNPEQWPREVWREDMRLMQQAGVNIVSIGIFSWSVIQPTEDTWDFEWLDEVFDLLHSYGIAVDLGTGTASPPPWLTTKHPEVLLVKEGGEVVTPGARQHWRPTSPIYLKYALELCRRMAERYGSHPALVAWHVNNELGCHNHFDYSDDAARTFRVFLEKRYQTIDKLNTAWDAAFWSQRYSTFAEILPPRITGRGTFLNPTQQLDWRRFSSNALVDYYRAERDLLRSITPDIPITTNLIVMGKQTKDRNYAEWVDELDFVSNDHYVFISPQGRDELSFSASLTSGLASHQPWFLMEHSTSAVQWQRVNTPKGPNELIRDSLTHLAHGADGLCFFQWRQSRGGAERYHSSMIPHAGPDSRLFREVVKLGAILKDLADIKGTVKERGQVAILFDWESWWVAEQTSQPSTLIDYKQEALDWYSALLDLGITADVIPLRQHNDLPYSVVIAPMLHVVPSHISSSLTAYVRSGGHLIATYWSGITNENAQVHLGGYPGAFSDLFGIRIEEFGPIAESVELDDGTEGTIWSEPIDIVEDVEVVRSYKTGPYAGGPAITSRLVATGRATYVSTKLDRHGLKKLLAAELARAGITTSLPDVLVGKVEQVFRMGRGSRWEFLINRGQHALQMKDVSDLVYSSNNAGGSLSAQGIAIHKRMRGS